MIKFFRHFRKNLIAEHMSNNQSKTNKPASPLFKYFIYAIGEIILVVIGILIALQINNWNEDRKSQNRNIQLLKRIHKELALNIKSSDNTTRFYRNIERDFYDILHEELTLEDYKKKDYLKYITMSFENVNLSDIDAKNLESFNDNINDAQDSLVFRINNLYKTHKPIVDKLDNELLKVTSEIIKKQRDTKEWFYLQDIETIPEVAYQYFLNDPFYLNDVSYFQTMALFNHHLKNMNFNTQAKSIYRDLSSYLGLEIDSTILKDSQKNLHYIGTFKHDEEVIKIREKDNKLVYSHGHNPNKTFDFNPTNDSLFVIEYTFGKLIRDKNKKVTGMTRTLGSFEPQTYQKVD